MEKAFDTKDLVEKFKSKGLTLAEKAAILLVIESLDWLKESFELTENKLDDVIIGFLPKAKDLLLELADEIDGEENLDA